jgi:predicted enzyme related to lactoylglutathione lyase
LGVGKGPTNLVGEWAWHHTGLTVRDLSRALDFYRVAFGFEVEFEAIGLADDVQRTLNVPRIRCDLIMCRALASGVRLELLRFTNIPEDAPSDLPLWPGSAHVAYAVEDIDAAIRQLEAAGGRQLGEVVSFPTGRSVYCWAASRSGVVEFEEVRGAGGPVRG